MNTPTFTTTTFLTRGHMEREIEVEIEYTFDGKNLEVVDARDLTEGRELTDWEWESCQDAVAGVCDEAFAEWQADRGEYLRDQREDARVAA